MDKISLMFQSLICNEFLPLLANKTNVELHVLREYWNEYYSGEEVLTFPTVIPPSPPTTKIYSASELNNFKIKDLKVLCGNLKLTKVGVKQQIIDRILDSYGQVKSHDTNEEDDVDGVSTVNSLNMEKFRAPDVKIGKNENGHWIHEETKIVFTSDEEYIDGIRCRWALGYEDEDGQVEDLTADMIETCNQYGFRYKEPLNIIV